MRRPAVLPLGVQHLFSEGTDAAARSFLSRSSQPLEGEGSAMMRSSTMYPFRAVGSRTLDYLALKS